MTTTPPGSFTHTPLRTALLPPLVCSGVYDVFDVLRVTVYDADRGGKSEFLGALVLPLLEVRLVFFFNLNPVK